MAGPIMAAAALVLGCAEAQAENFRSTLMVSARVLAPSCLVAAARRDALTVSCSGSAPHVVRATGTTSTASQPAAPAHPNTTFTRIITESEGGPVVVTVIY
ncbi:hypothetical protein ACFOD4_08220 [Pseudoroseomonas globiformis]|uniref:Spore coat protein U domain-containing protein n=1 Tax=Teichococcus globiformis TaxID=2307229 RepID=A0ABV7FXD6_9PROT